MKLNFLDTQSNNNQSTNNLRQGTAINSNEINQVRSGRTPNQNSQVQSSQRNNKSSSFFY